MKVRIAAPQGYSDRYGDFHPQNEHVEYPETLAQKLILHGLATRVHEKQEEPAEAPPENVVRRKSRPRKKG